MKTRPICIRKLCWMLMLVEILVAVAERRAAHGQIHPMDQAGSSKTSSSSASGAAFDVAVVRQNNSDQHARLHIYSSPANGEFKAVNVTLIALLRYASGLPETQI